MSTGIKGDKFITVTDESHWSTVRMSGRFHNGICRDETEHQECKEAKKILSKTTTNIYIYIKHSVLRKVRGMFKQLKSGMWQMHHGLAAGAMQSERQWNGDSCVPLQSP